MSNLSITVIQLLFLVHFFNLKNTVQSTEQRSSTSVLWNMSLTCVYNLQVLLFFSLLLLLFYILQVHTQLQETGSQTGKPVIFKKPHVNHCPHNPNKQDRSAQKHNQKKPYLLRHKTQVQCLGQQSVSYCRFFFSFITFIWLFFRFLIIIIIRTRIWLKTNTENYVLYWRWFPIFTHFSWPLYLFKWITLLVKLLQIIFLIEVYQKTCLPALSPIPSAYPLYAPENPPPPSSSSSPSSSMFAWPWRPNLWLRAEDSK